MDGLKSFREDLESYFADLWRLLRALGVWGVAFVLSAIILMALPVIFSVHIGKLTDAIIGARGIGVMTVDVTKALRMLLGATIFGFLAEMFLSRFEGKAATLTKALYTIGATIVLFVMLLNLGWWGMAIWPLLLLILRRVLNKVPYLQYVFVVPVVLLFLSLATNVITYAVIRAVTVGDAMGTVTAAGLYAVLMSGLLLGRKTG